MQNNYCKLYVDSSLPEFELIEAVRAIVAGTLRGHATICSAVCEMDIEDNDEFDEERKADPTDGFLYFRYFFDVEPVAGVSMETYVDFLAAILVSMRRRGIGVVPACDFEDLLPKP